MQGSISAIWGNRKAHTRLCGSDSPAQRWPLPRVFLVILSLKAYGLLVLYVLFLKTGLRNGDKGFLYRPGGQPLDERSADIEASFWERLAPYDGQWYLDISENGYRSLTPVEAKARGLPPGNYAFFPLLPGILRASRIIFGAGFLPAVILLLTASSALGAILVYVLARRLEAPAALSVALLVAFPTAVFQLVLYTEGLFLLLSAAALLFALKRNAPLAAVAGGLAGLTRPQGILLVLPFFVEFLLPMLRGREPATARKVVARSLVVLTPISGFILLGVFSAAATGSFLSFVEIQGRWGRSFAPWNVLTTLGSVVGYGGPPVDLLGLAFGLGLLPVIWRRLPASLALYGTALVFLPLSTGSLMSMGRFLSVSVPHFLALALCLRSGPAVFRAGVLGTLAAAQVLLASGFLAWHLVG